jgi:RNA polymerase-binding transcription factor DksA
MALVTRAWHWYAGKRTPMTLNPTFLAQQKEKLLADKQRLEDELMRIGKKDPVVPNDYDATPPDFGRSPDENALEEETYEARLGVEYSLERHLKDINTALGRMEQGTYGTCTVCGDRIDEKRLNAFPAATACMKHGTAQ